MAVKLDAKKIVGAAGASAIALFTGSLVGVAGLGLMSPDIDVMGVPKFYFDNWHVDAVRGWFFKGVGAVAVAIGAAAVFAMRKKVTLHGDASWANEQQIRGENLRAEKGILLGRKGTGFLRFGGSEHVLLEAPTRAGKGVGVVIPNLLEWPDSVVVLDVKQENWDLTAGYRQSTGHRVVLFDPLNTEGRTVRYNPLAYINRRDEIEVINELQKIAAMLFPPPMSGDSFWADSARTAFIGVGAYVAATAIDDSPGQPFTIGEIYRNLTIGNPKTRFPQLIAEREASGRPLSGPCVSALNDFTSSSDNTFTSIRQSVTARIGLWLNPYVDAATSESDFDFRDFRSERISLYLGVSPDNIERVSDLYNLMFQQLVDLNVRELPTATTNNVQLLVLLDEFARLGRASVIAAGFSYVAGYGIRLLPVIQSRSQLRAVYGKDVCDEIVANCGIELAFTPKEGAVADELSKRLGYYTFKSTSRSSKEFEAFGRTLSVSDQKRALLLPQELLEFPKTEVIVLRGGIPPIKGTKLAYYSDRHFADKAKVPAPGVVARPIDLAAVARATAEIARAEMLMEEITDEEAAAETVDPSALDPAVTESLPDEPDMASIEALIDTLSFDDMGR